MKKKILFIVYGLFLVPFLYGQQPTLILPVGHPQGILQVIGTPNGKYIFSRSFNDRNLRIWSTGNGMMVAEINVKKSFANLIPSNDSKYLLINSGEIFVYWDIEKHQPAYTISDRLDDLSLSPDNRYIGGYETKRFLLYESLNGEKTFEKSMKDTIVSVQFLKKNQILIVCKKKNKRKFMFYDIENKTWVNEFELSNLGDWRFDEHEKYNCILSNNSTFIKMVLLSSQTHNIIKVKGRKSLGKSNGIWDFSPLTGKYIIGFPEKGTVQVFNPDTSFFHYRKDFGRGMTSAIFVNRGKNIAVKTDFNYSLEYFNERLDWLNMKFSNEVANLKNVPAQIYYQNKSNKFYAVLDDNIIREYVSESDTCQQIQEYKGNTCEITDLVFFYDNLFISNGCGSIKKIDLSLSKLTDDFKISNFNIHQIEFNKEANQIFSIDQNHQARIFNTLGTKELKSFTFQKKIEAGDYFLFSSLSVAGKNLLMEYGGFKNSNFLKGKLYYEIRDNKTLKVLKMKNLRGCKSGTLVLNKNGKQLIYVNQTDSTVSINSLDFKPLMKIKINDWVMSAKQSHTGKYLLVSATSYIYIYDYENGKQLHKFPLLLGNLADFDFSPNDSSLIFNSNDGSIEIWQLNPERKKGHFKVHEEGILVSPYFIDNNKFVTISEDGFLKVWKINNDGIEPIFSMVPFENTEYATIIPKGYYQCNPNSAKRLHYITQGIKVITFNQLDVKYNRPDKVLEAIGCSDTALINSYRQAYYKRIKKLGIDTTQFKDGYSVPEADFVNRDSIEYEQKNSQLKLHIHAIDSTYKLDRFNIWINEAPLFGLRGISLKAKDRNEFDTTIIIKLSQGENSIETSIINTNGTESYKMPLHVKFTPETGKVYTPKLHFIGIGINEFANSKYNLSWSVKDIRDFSVKLKNKYENDIEIDTLFNENVSTEKVKALKQKLLASNINDKVIVAYSGHGMLSKNYDYYLSTFNVNFDKPEENGLAYDELENLLDSIPARQKLMLIDACHSGELDKEELQKLQAIATSMDSTSNKSIKTKGIKIFVDSSHKTIGIKNSFELMQNLFVNVGKGTGATIISAAAGTQFALERGDLKNGVFTYSILELFEKNKTITVSQLKKYVNQRVAEITKGAQQPTSRTETLQNDWRVW